MKNFKVVLQIEYKKEWEQLEINSFSGSRTAFTSIKNEEDIKEAIKKYLKNNEIIKEED